MSKIEKNLFFALVFLLPTQLAIHFWPPFALIYGIRVDYLAPTIFLTDILVVILLAFGFKEIYKYKKFIALLILFSVFNILFSISPTITLIKWFKVLELTFLVIYIANKVNKNDWKNVYKTLFLSLILFSLIGIGQFVIGHTIGGPLRLLGERNFTISTPGIALNTLFGVDVLRAYSTFPHPNVLSGYLGLSTIFLFAVGFFNDKRKFIGLIIILLCFLLSFSLSSFIAILLACFLWVIRNNKHFFWKTVYVLFAVIILGSLTMPIISSSLDQRLSLNKNISERLSLAVIAGKITSQHYLTGSGLNTFTLAMTKVKPATTTSWLLQPAHNIFLLALSEVGAFGLLMFVYFFYKLLKKYPHIFIFVLVTGFFDHYWIDSQQTMLLLTVISGFVFKPKK